LNAKTTAGFHLRNAANLSKDWGPPLSAADPADGNVRETDETVRSLPDESVRSGSSMVGSGGIIAEV